MTNQDILDFLESFAPFATAEDWDNPGLLIGSPEDELDHVAVALDATPEAIEAAKAVGAQLLLTHHPMIFTPLRAIPRRHPAFLAAEAGLSVIAAHTNLDKAAGGVNDALAALLGLTDVTVTEDGFCRIGTLPTPMQGFALGELVASTLHTAVRVNKDTPVKTLAVCGGAGGFGAVDMVGKADAFLTGEVKHHEWLEANALGIVVLEAGHYATEQPVVDALRDKLTEAFPALTVTKLANGAPYDTVLG